MNPFTFHRTGLKANLTSRSSSPREPLQSNYSDAHKNEQVDRILQNTVVSLSLSPSMCVCCFSELVSRFSKLSASERKFDGFVGGCSNSIDAVGQWVRDAKREKVHAFDDVQGGHRTEK